LPQRCRNPQQNYRVPYITHAILVGLIRFRHVKHLPGTAQLSGGTGWLEVGLSHEEMLEHPCHKGNANQNHIKSLPRSC
jgi:hypothetical protein